MVKEHQQEIKKEGGLIQSWGGYGKPIDPESEWWKELGGGEWDELERQNKEQQRKKAEAKAKQEALMRILN